MKRWRHSSAHDGHSEPPASRIVALDLSRELERLHPDCWGWALSCCRGNRGDAEDVLQTSYLKVLDGRAVYRGHANFKSWLFGVIRMTAIEQRRKVAVRRFFTGGAPDELEAVDGAPSPMMLTEQSDLSARLLQSLTRLSDQQREVIHLVFYQEMSIEQAATVMRVSVGTARTHYERGKVRLREILASEMLT